MTSEEEQAGKKVEASERQAFGENFWRRRDPNRSTIDNEFRTEFERRARAADERFRSGRGWNDCGRTFVLLGKPDLVEDATGRRHFASSDRLEAMREQEDTLAETWFYRNPAALPQSPQGYRFRFTRVCESLDGSAARLLLQRVAASYIQER
jgi:GWxTD domain-containing protein